MMKVMSDKQEDQSFGIIIIGVLMPIVVGGLAVFGWYSLNGEYSVNKKIDDYRWLIFQVASLIDHL